VAKPDPELPAVTAKPDPELPALTVKPNLAPSSPMIQTAPGAPVPRLRIKNASAIRVTLGTRRHEPASAIRPEKGIWNVVLASDLTGASAELVDLTPTLPVAAGRWRSRATRSCSTPTASRPPTSIRSTSARNGR
jgi:hypothetical protein